MHLLIVLMTHPLLSSRSNLEITSIAPHGSGKCFMFGHSYLCDRNDMETPLPSGSNLQKSSIARHRSANMLYVWPFSSLRP